MRPIHIGLMGKSLVTLKLQICLAYFAFGENIEGQDYNIDPAVLFASSKVRTVGRLDRDSGHVFL